MFCKILKFFNIYKCLKCNKLYYDKYFILDGINYLCDNCLINYDDYIIYLEKELNK